MLFACANLFPPNADVSQISLEVNKAIQGHCWRNASGELLSRAVTNISVNYEKGAAELAQQLFGALPPDEEIAGLAGALEGALVKAAVRRAGLYLAVEHPWFECYETSIRRDRNNDLYAHIHDVRKRAREPRDVVVRAFFRQVVTARKLGLKRFELYAPGYFNDTRFSGYRFWPRLGFNARLTLEEQTGLPLNLAGAQDLNQLILLPGGYAWWKEKGSERSMVFDLAENSEMMKVFRERLKAAGLTKE